MLAANAGLLAVLNGWLGMALVWAKLVTEVVLFALSYHIQRLLAFLPAAALSPAATSSPAVPEDPPEESAVVRG